MSTLGTIRRWIQWNALNGSEVIWGSEDALHFSRMLRVCDMEDLAKLIDEDKGDTNDGR